MNSLNRLFTLVLLPALAVGGASSGCSGSSDEPLPAASCSAGTAFAAGTSFFTEVTDAVGLAGVLGQRVNVVDIDGDGYPDVLIRRGGQAVEDFAAATGGRNTWLMHNKGNGTFEDVTESSGILQLRNGEARKGRPVTVAAFADVDNDGDMDAYMGVAASDPAALANQTTELMLNDGTGTFVLGPETSDVRGIARGGDSPGGASFIDYDRDGNVDLWLPQSEYATGDQQQSRLLRGDGHGSFTDFTDAVGLTERPFSALADVNAGLSYTRTWSAVACDVNGDGTPELMAGSYGRQPNHLYQGTRDADGNVTFANHSVESGYAFDGDQSWKDNEFAKCFCKANPTAEDCTGLGQPRLSCSNNWDHTQDRQPYRLGGNSGSTACADLDNDGDLDLVTSEIKHWWAGQGADGSEILVNRGAADAVFDRPGNATTGYQIPHTTVDWDEGNMTNTVFDFDNDGWLDIYQGGSDYDGNRGRLFRQDSPMHFTEVATADFFAAFRSHGVAVADFDRDGDQDIIVGHSLSRCTAGECLATDQIRMWTNTQAQQGNWVALTLTGGEHTNRSAIGARITVTMTDAAGVTTTQTREVGGGFGHFGSQDDVTQTIGLGTACEAEVTVRWPDATLSTQSFKIVAGYRFTVHQGEGPKVAPEFEAKAAQPPAP